MGIFKKNFQKNDVPKLNTASLPDLIFTVLFFFMIVTQMRHGDVLVRFTQPNGTELTKLSQKSSATYIYVGKDMNNDNENDNDNGNGYTIQIDNQIVSPEQVYSYMIKKTENMTEAEKSKVVINLKADKNVPMSIILNIKESLKKANTRLVHYSANEKD